jgi:uncharacterized protein YfdQ (DUF2303 family)
MNDKMINYLLLKIAQNKNNHKLVKHYRLLLNEAIKQKMANDYNTNKKSI